MRPSADLRSALLTIGNAAIGVGLGMSVLGGALVVSQFAAGHGSATQASPSPSAPSLVLVDATTPPPAAPTLTTAPTSSPRPTDTPPTATATPSPTPATVAIAAYTNGGKRYAALRAPVGHVYVAPIAGAVRVQLYQLIDGDVRIGSFVPSLPFFPYITVESTDRRVTFRPGALNADTELLIKDGERVELGTPLFRTVGEGASSWRTFYDRGVTANVVVSVAVLPAGTEIDPVVFLRGG